MEMLCLINEVLVFEFEIEVFVYQLVMDKDVFYLGCGVFYLFVFEGVLKLKEISYLYVEGYVVGEFKYGLIVLIENGL